MTMKMAIAQASVARAANCALVKATLQPALEAQQQGVLQGFGNLGFT